MPTILRTLNVIAECRAQRLAIWSCPPFLFVVMGLVNVSAMVSSYLLSSRYIEEPQLAALVVIAVSLLVFVLGVLLINGFQKIAEANRMKSEFIAIVSHQLRSPLSIFKWTVDALTRPEPSPNPTGQAQYFSILRDNTEKMIQLINTLLEVSRIDSGRLELKREAVDLAALTAELVRSFGPYARAARITLRYYPSPNLPPVRGDGERLKMVVQNLIDNAIRYSPSGGEISISITPRGGSALSWQIQDRGVGIPLADQRFIFQKFYRARSGPFRPAQGSGLGLYFARAIVQELGGAMGFDSAEGKGSTFWFWLPIYR